MTLDAKSIVSAVRPHVVPLDEHPPIIDFERSQGARLCDASDGRLRIDFAASYASVPLGYNHPGLALPDFEKELLKVSRVRIANLDLLSDSYAKFLTTFRRVVGAEGFDRFFFVDGGALAVENAIKTAMDWKVRRNLARGKGERGFEILHFREAFHGRSGYTLSVTNTHDPNKTKYFQKFAWPRVSNPKCVFPLEGANLADTIAREEFSKAEILRILQERSDDIAAILIEPIQGEGGDNHFRREFLQFLRNVSVEYDTLLIFDEVQCGMGVSGRAWTAQAVGVLPDIICFAKKAQVGGFMAGPRLMEEPQNVFTVPSRISSTWGSSLTDMVRCTRILEIIEQENLFENAAQRGAEILEALHKIQRETELITNIRGRGLFIAFDLVYPETRSQLVSDLYRRGLKTLVCGDKAVRFRPHLNVTSDIIGEAMALVGAALQSVSSFASKSD